MVAGAIGVGIVWFFQRAASPRPVSDAAIAAAEAAGCSEVQTPATSAPGGVHLQPGESHTYPDHPATSGPHDPSPLPIPPRVYTEPISETNAVHNLEHGAVIMYYRQSGDAALPQDVVDRLATIANDGHNTILAPYATAPGRHRARVGRVEQASDVSGDHHGVAGRNHRERVHRCVPVYEQRPRGQPRRGLLARQDVWQCPPLAQVIVPCSNVAEADPSSCVCTRDVGNPSAPSAPPWEL